jgi:hypothetical protein
MKSLKVQSFSVDSSRSLLFRDGDPKREGRFTSGFVVTPFGVVGVWMWSDDSRGETSYTFGFDGRDYQAFEDRARTPRGIAIMAGRFARKIAQGWRP